MLLVILIARSSLRISSASISLCANTHTYKSTRTYMFHPPATIHMYAVNGLCRVSRTIYFPNLLVWWELYHLVARHSFFRSLYCFSSLASPSSVVVSIQKCGSSDKIASSTRSLPRVRVRLITEMPFAHPEVRKMLLYVVLVSDQRRYHWTLSSGFH